MKPVAGYRMSRGFISALVGVAMTLFAWFGPWEWPAWPAFAILDVAFGTRSYAEFPYLARAATLVGLIVVNVTFWGLIVSASAAAIRFLSTRGNRSKLVPPPDRP